MLARAGARCQTGSVERIPAGLVAAALVFVVCTGLFGAGRQSAHAAGPSDVLPGLVADPPANPRLDYYAYSDGTHDLLLRFDRAGHNPGPRAFEIPGPRPSTADAVPPLHRVRRAR